MKKGDDSKMQTAREPQGLWGVQGDYVFPVDRWRAATRGAWRLLLVGVLTGALYVPRIDWPAMWRGQPATCLAMGFLFLGVALAAMGLTVSGVRWLVLALWRGATEIRVTGEGVTARLGPFGSHGAAWSALRLELYDGVDLDMLDHLPDDSMLFRFHDRRDNRDIGSMIMLFSGCDLSALNRALRPFFNESSLRR